MKQATTPGGTMAYVDEGEGPAVVLVHGTPSSSHEWREVIRTLSPNFRVLAPDLLGFGQSDRPRDWRTYTLPWHTENLQAWFNQVVPGDYHLVVHDFGGPVALPIALERPGLRSLTIMQSWFWDLKAPKVDNFVMRWLYLRANFSARVLVKLSWGRRAKLTRETHREFKARFPDRDSRAGTWGFARSISHEGPYLDELAPGLERLRDVPALVVWGLADKLVRPENLERWKQTLPAAKTLELPDVGHFPQVEAAEETATALQKFISEV